MSDQSQFFNPQLDRMALSGAGFILPRLTTAQRLGLSVGPNDAGLQLFDTTVGTIQLWTGSAWTSVGGGGGMQRVLATTLTFTGTPTTRPNQVTATVTGTCPAPTSVLPGRTLQSVQYWVSPQIDSNITLQYKSVGDVSDARAPYMFNINGIQYTGYQSFTITAASTGQTVNLINFPLPRIVEQDATGLVFPFAPSVTLRLGEPNYGRETGTTVVAENFLVNSLQLDGTIKVYYLFE